VVLDHDTPRLMWAAPGHDTTTLGRFFDARGPQPCEQVRLVSADAAEWIAMVVAARCPAATLCADPFHVVKWASDALHRSAARCRNAARKHGQAGLAREIKGAPYALWKNPEDLTGRQRRKLAWIAKVDDRLYRATAIRQVPTSSRTALDDVHGPRTNGGRFCYSTRIRTCGKEGRTSRTSERAVHLSAEAQISSTIVYPMEGARPVRELQPISAECWHHEEDTAPLHGRLVVVHPGDYWLHYADGKLEELMPGWLFDALYRRHGDGQYVLRSTAELLAKQHPSRAFPVEIQAVTGPQLCNAGDWVFQYQNAQWVVPQELFSSAFTQIISPRL
jgi:hypothetical protein